MSECEFIQVASRWATEIDNEWQVIEAPGSVILQKQLLVPTENPTDTEWIDADEWTVRINRKLVRWNVHVFYSNIWQCPVVYWNVFDDATGMPIGWAISDSQPAVMMHDHPILNIPYWHLHPCHTKTQVMRCKSHTEMLCLWLSLVDEAFRKLKIPIRCISLQSASQITRM